MPRAAIIEDSRSDLWKAAEVLKRLGVNEITEFTRVDKALLYLQDVVEGKSPGPDVIVLDLHFNLESGFEVLRFRRSNPKLNSIPLVVWTQMGETEQELCRFFGAKVIQKSGDSDELQTALKSLAASTGS